VPYLPDRDLNYRPPAHEAHRSLYKIVFNYKTVQVEENLKLLPASKYVHAFYYAWYGNPQFDGKFYHWDHEFLPHWKSEISRKYATGERHVPPDDIGMFYVLIMKF